MHPRTCMRLAPLRGLCLQARHHGNHTHPQHSFIIQQVSCSKMLVGLCCTALQAMMLQHSSSRACAAGCQGCQGCQQQPGCAQAAQPCAWGLQALQQLTRP